MSRARSPERREVRGQRPERDDLDRRRAGLTGDRDREHLLETARGRGRGRAAGRHLVAGGHEIDPHADAGQVERGLLVHEIAEGHRTARSLEIDGVGIPHPESAVTRVARGERTVPVVVGIDVDIRGCRRAVRLQQIRRRMNSISVGIQVYVLGGRRSREQAEQRAQCQKSPDVLHENLLETAMSPGHATRDLLRGRHVGRAKCGAGFRCPGEVERADETSSIVSTETSRTACSGLGGDPDVHRSVAGSAVPVTPEQRRF